MKGEPGEGNEFEVTRGQMHPHTNTGGVNLEAEGEQLPPRSALGLVLGLAPALTSSIVSALTRIVTQHS